MRIELTVAFGAREEDVLVEAPDDSALRTVLPALADAVGASPEQQLWRGEQLLAPTTTLAEAGLRAGAVLSFGGRSGAPPQPVLALHVAGGPAAGRIVPLERGRLTIGRAPTCDLVLPDPDASRRHAVLDVMATAITLTDLDSTNGTTVDGHRVPPGGVPLHAGSLIAIGDSLLTVAGPVDAPAALQPGRDGTLLLLRPPRRTHAVPAREITLPTRPHAARPRAVQWLTALLPAAAGAALAWWAHMPQFLLFALLSPAMMISTALGDRVQWRRSRRRATSSFRRRLAAAELQVAEGLAAEAAARRAAAPDPATLLRQVTLPGSRVWERRRSDTDLLRLRIGSADLPSTLTTREGSVVSTAGTLAAVPLCVDLRHGPLGIAGPPDVSAGSARWLVGQLAALHSPADVQLAVLVTPERCADWEWARWLPQLRAVAASEPEWPAVVSELSAVVGQRLADRRIEPDGWRGPWLVLVIDRAGAMAEVPGLAELLAGGASVGVTAVCLDTDAAALPSACASVTRVRGVTGTRLLLREPNGTEQVAVADQVSRGWAADLARGLAPLVDAGASGTAAMPDACTLGEVLGLDSVTPAAITERWTAAKGGARCVLGASSDGVLTVDLAADGPHALLAGTTGAGKSELLQSIVVSLAVNHAPDDVNFLLIDYKGGAAFADCARLPHCSGLVTDLDPYLTERALRALHSELRRRERLFAAVSASDLAGYRAASPGEPIPRLIIVVDEFAALVDELPEFVRGLVGVAQRGRSLGVHLVLATQRPGSAVSAEIRANTALRVALRVTDPGESRDVIDSPLAASIAHSMPGRGYLRAGAALTCFQAPHASGSTAGDRDRIDVERLGPWRRQRGVPAEQGSSDLSRLVDAVCAAAVEGSRPLARGVWLPPLPEELPRALLEPPTAGTAVALGWVDLPDQQRRATLSFDLRAGTSLLVAGAAQSGRTSALVSLAVGAAGQLGPAELHLHVIDATGTLATAVRSLPHCATVLGPEELALAPRLLNMLGRESARRFAEPATDGRPRPRQLLLVDGWDAFAAALPELDAAVCVDAMAGLLRVGAAAGLSIALTGDRAVLAPRFAGGFADRVLLRLTDRNDYALAGVGIRDVPATLPPGRGVRASDRAVVQLAHAGTPERPDVMRRETAAAAARWRDQQLGRDAIRIRALPARVALTELPAGDGRLALGLAGDRLDPVVVDPFAGAGRVLVAGPPRSGKTTVLRLLARQAHAAGIPTLIAAPSRSPLAEDAQLLTIPVLTPGADVGGVPADRTLLLVDDSEAFADSTAGDGLTAWVRTCEARLAVVVAGRADDLATSYRGLAAEVRRSQCGILLRPGPVDGELLGVRLPRRPPTGPPGRGVVVGDPSWGPLFADGEPVPIQVAAL